MNVGSLTSEGDENNVLESKCSDGIPGGPRAEESCSGEASGWLEQSRSWGWRLLWWKELKALRPHTEKHVYHHHCTWLWNIKHIFPIPIIKSILSIILIFMSNIYKSIVSHPFTWKTTWSKSNWYIASFLYFTFVFEVAEKKDVVEKYHSRVVKVAENWGMWCADMCILNICRWGELG